MNKDEQSYKLKTRKLGDEWKDWTGEIEDNSGDLETGPALFITVFFITTITIITALWGSFFLFVGYFESSYKLNLITNLILIGLSLLLISYFVLLFITYKTKKPFAFFLKDKKITDLYLTHITLFYSKRIGFKHDKVLNSMLNFSNSLTKVLYKGYKKDEILILVPRCLAKQTREELNSVINDYNINVHIAAGGTEARQILKENKPKGIIAVACERDLYAGVKDVPSQIPVIAIANKRPNGPCKNTLVNSDEMKEAIESFIKK